MKGKNQSSLKEENTSVVLKLLRENQGMSRADIVRSTNLTPPTVSRIVAFLIENNLLTEKKIKSNNVGRNPIGLYFNNDAFYIISIDFSYLHIIGAVMNLSGKIIEQTSIEVKSDSFSRRDMDKVERIISSFVNHFPIRRILGIGFSCPGMIDHDKGIVISVPHFPKINNLPVKKILEEKYGLRTIVINDANAEAVGEKYFGSGRGVSDFLLLHLGYGIGSGIILNNKLYTGNFGVSGEIGHTSIDRKGGKQCDCGNRGCVELYAGLNGILSDVSKSCGRKVSTVSQLRELVSHKNERTIKILEDKAKLIGYVLVNAVNLLAPKKIIISGPLTSLEDVIIKPMRELIEKRSFYGIGKKIPIVRSKLEGNNCLIGAMTVVLEEFLEKPYDFIS